MSKKVSIDQLEDAIMQELNEYASLASDDLKDAVRKTAKDVRTDIRDSAPVRTGKYKSSWSVKKVSETADSINLVVHSRNRYQIAHLLRARPRQARRRQSRGKASHRPG
jgi:gas vesicle protein